MQPAMQAALDIEYIDFNRPRAALVTLLGEELQNSPALVFSEGEQPEGVNVSSATGRAYLNDGRAICRWLGETWGGMVPS